VSSRTLLVAEREIRAILRLKSFWFTLVSFPLLIALGGLVGTLLGNDEPERLMIVDRSGGKVGAALVRRIEIDHQREVMRDLARYVERMDLGAETRRRIWATPGRWFDDATVARFEREGGLAAAEQELERIRPANASRFEAPEPSYEIVAAPGALRGGEDAAVARAAARLTDGEDLADRVDYLVDVPPNFGPNPVVRIWAASSPRQSLVAGIEVELTRALRTRLLAANGVSDEVASAASLVAPAIQLTIPRDGEGRDGMMIRSAAPAFSVYLLIMAIFVSATWMLQSTVEERGDKLIESVLACAAPDELLHGKLIGTVAVTSLVVLAWVGAAAAAVPFLPADVLDLLKIALAPLASASNILAFAYFFVAGYLLASMMFLAVGALSNSMQESQAYLTPVMLILLVPISVLLQPATLESGGRFLEIAQWIPIYTPFVVLVRLGNGVPVWELLATAALVAGFLALEFVGISRLFHATLLRTGQPPRLGELLRLMRRGQADAFSASPPHSPG
jgi:ABC-2 type transport system permease protein